MREFMGICPVCREKTDFMPWEGTDNVALECVICGGVIPVHRLHEDLDPFQRKLDLDIEQLLQALMLFDSRPT